MNKKRDKELKRKIIEITRASEDELRDKIENLDVSMVVKGKNVQLKIGGILKQLLFPSRSDVDNEK